VQLFASGSGTFSWQPNYNLTNIHIANPVASPDVTTTYTVTLSNNFGCFTRDSVTIHVFDTIIISAEHDTTLCPGQSVQLNASGLGLTVFSWSPTTGLNNPNIPNPIATPPFTTTYFVSSSIGSCVGTDAVTITVKPFPVIFAGPDYTICEGDTAQLSASGGTSYSWTPTGSLTDPSSATPLAFPNSTTTYAVVGLDANSCNQSVTDSEKVVVIPKPDIVITTDTTIILGTCINLSITGGGTYLWFPNTALNSDTSATPTACPTDPTMYYVNIFTVGGCPYLDSVFIDINPNPLVIFPNAFSPNDDGKNDYFRPVVLGLAKIDQFLIFNRWGAIVFEADNVSVVGGPMPVQDSWDGEFNSTKQPVGVYVYYLKGTGSATGDLIERHGDFTLVR
jgi:gliding motility-associated-like protein